MNPIEQQSFPDLPKGLTSFGAAVWEDDLFLYGGHFGHAHEYYREGQSDQFLRLSLSEPRDWELLPAGPRLQGLAMVAQAGKLYRVGGFAARNEKGADQDLWSEADVAGFDLASKTWEPLPSLPSPRSSHDAVVLENRIYVAGGWALEGGKNSRFHQTALVLDLAAEPLAWEELPVPPFQRRALALGTLGGKVYVIGGMQEAGEPTTAVAVFDPQTNRWSEGPPLIGSPMAGFGPAACRQAGKLFVSTYEGSLQALEEGSSGWQTIEQIEPARFFHRMLPLGSRQLLMIGGANMEAGKFKSLQAVSLES